MLVVEVTEVVYDSVVTKGVGVETLTVQGQAGIWLVRRDHNVEGARRQNNLRNVMVVASVTVYVVFK